jgi:hypothetical protein
VVKDFDNVVVLKLLDERDLGRDVFPPPVDVFQGNPSAPLAVPSFVNLDRMSEHMGRGSGRYRADLPDQINPCQFFFIFSYRAFFEELSMVLTGHDVGCVAHERG